MHDVDDGPAGRLLGPWGAPDLTAFLRARLSDAEDAATVRFWDRAAGAFVPMAQRDLFHQAAACGARLVAGGVAPGDPVLVVANRPEAVLTAWFGAVLVGAHPAVVPVRRSFDDPEAAAARLRGTAAMLGPRTRAAIEVGAGGPAFAPAALPGSVLVDLDELRRDVRSLPLPPPELRPTHPDDVAYLQLTSGSTGAGRAVAVTHRGLIANIGATATRLGITDDDRFVSWLPLYHDMGLVGMALLGLLTGSDTMLLTPFEFVADPTAWLGAFGRDGATITATPNFALERCCERIADPVAAGLDLSGCRSVHVGAEPVRPGTLRRFVDRFGPVGFEPTMLKPCYGLAEATLAVTLPGPEVAPRVLRVAQRGAAGLGRLEARASGTLSSLPPAGLDDLEVVALGRPLDGLVVRIVDETGATIREPLRCGEITASGATLAAGYWQDGRLLPFGEELSTGDIGFVHDGDLFVLERVKNVVIHNGENWSAAVLEAIVGEALGTSGDHVLVFEPDLLGRPGELEALVEAGKGVSARDLVERLRPRLGTLPVTITELGVIGKGALPRTTSGKKQPSEARARLRTGALKVIDRAPVGLAPDEVIDLRSRRAPGGDVAGHVIEVLAERCRSRGRAVEVAPGSSLVGDLGLDSLDLFELAVGFEEDLGSVIPEADLGAVRTVADLVALASRTDAAPLSGITAAIAGLHDQIPQIFRTATAQVGRRVEIDGRWRIDFASCNYLGLDLHPEVVAAIPPMVARWGVHPSWTRAVASPQPYVDLEAGLAALVGAPDTLVFPTVTLTHLGVLPSLAGRTGAILLDQAAHHSIQEAAGLAAHRGTTVRTFRHDDLDALEHALAGLPGASRRVIAVDGVYSMSGRTADLAGILAVAERHDAVVYVDDAHGLGILGAAPTQANPYGSGGGGVVRHLGLDHERVVYVGGLSKAFSSLAAFVTCRDAADRRSFERASTMVFSGPVPTASLASALAGLAVNEREGDELRARLLSVTQRTSDGLRALGFDVGDHGAFPIITVTIGDVGATVAACRLLWEHGILLTPAVFPAAPIDAGGVRLTLTASHDDADVDELLAAFAALRSSSEVLGAAPGAAVL